MTNTNFTPPVKGWRVGGKTIPELALLLMLGGVLLPSAKYSFSLNNPSPAELLIAICIALFSSVVFLWILDATSILKFRSEWVSRSIYGGAIASVLGTSVAVYQDAFSARKHPMEGKWDLQITGASLPSAISHSVLLIYSDQSQTYFGYSDYRFPNDPSGSNWIEVRDFNPDKPEINIRVLLKSGDEKIFSDRLVNERNNKLFVSTKKNDFEIRIARPN